MQGFNACPYGTVPSYNAGMGLSCIPIQYLQGMGNLAYWNWDPYQSAFSFYGWQSSGFASMGAFMMLGSCSGSFGCGTGSCLPLGGLGVSFGICGHSSYEYQYDYGYDYYDYYDYGYGYGY